MAIATYDNRDWGFDQLVLKSPTSIYEPKIKNKTYLWWSQPLRLEAKTLRTLLISRLWIWLEKHLSAISSLPPPYSLPSLHPANSTWNCHLCFFLRIHSLQMPRIHHYSSPFFPLSISVKIPLKQHFTRYIEMDHDNVDEKAIITRYISSCLHAN